MCMRENKRRISSMLRDNMVHDIYNEEIAKLGDLSSYVSKEYIYGKIQERIGLSQRTISYIINHTRKTEISG